MENFNSKDMAMKAQKKILSNMANKSVVQMFIDDTSSEILDELYRVSKEYTGNRNEAQKVIKDLIKVVVKIAVLFRHNCFSEEELRVAQNFKKKLHQGAMTAISFHETFSCCCPVFMSYKSHEWILLQHKKYPQRSRFLMRLFIMLVRLTSHLTRQ
ncbi:tumor necrosis factor, alpha-induced protein 8-like protein 2 B isoform X3 [Electrophorus electricus]|uniref:tumor necrosis factor, alpha-induced protein 8-like protein 2 B isoform X3 n=1 Tax=Electrophorus electricus TaxID=8005 RepID=UPI0015D0334D|nr:tumor necrosis factor, alpha-induced protein 8-like protein 2 B isoform X3 [Electrophorus electricus]